MNSTQKVARNDTQMHRTLGATDKFAPGTNQQSLDTTRLSPADDSNTFADGSKMFDAYSIMTSIHVEQPGFVSKPAELVRKAKFSKNRMVEGGINLLYPDTFSTLNKLSDPVERNTQERMKVYECYTDMVIQAITNKDKREVKKQLEVAQDWLERNKEAVNFRQQLKGKSYD